MRENDDEEKQIRRERFQRKRNYSSDDREETVRRNKIPYKRSRIDYDPTIDEFDEWLDDNA